MKSNTNFYKNNSVKSNYLITLNKILNSIYLFIN